MWSHYELREWLGKYYIVYSDESTAWNDKAKPLKYEQYRELERLDDKHRAEMQKAMIDLIKGETMIEFTYTKANGDVSERKAVVLGAPRDNFLVGEIDHLSPGELEELEDVLDDLREQRRQVLIDFRVGYKTFKPSGMEIKA
jgi:hypothetical protein